jgi:hypothetical protein
MYTVQTFWRVKCGRHSIPKSIGIEDGDSYTLVSKEFSLWPERIQAILCAENCLNFILQCVPVFPKAFLQWPHRAEAAW